MDVRERLALLCRAAVYDDLTTPGGGSADDGRGLFAPPGDGPIDRDVLPCVSHLTTPDGQRRAVLKVLQTSSCQNDCRYCAFRAGRDTRRTHVTPDEMARSFDLMVRAGLVEGMFLSSGVAGVNRTMDEMLATAELIREKYGYRGYLHLKLLPGADAGHVEAAVRLADRVSANLEGATPDRLVLLAPKKQMAELLTPLRIAAQIRRRLIESGELQPRREPGPRGGPAGDGQEHRWGNARLGLSTQFVVGPAGETDRELLSTVQMLYRELHLARTYYSAFTPVARTPLEDQPPTPPMREHRLYQADWLLRFYDFAAGELPFDPDGQLRTDIDPKTAWARAHPERFPIEVNQAPLNQLLRIPGIGPHSARAILEARRLDPLREIGDLRRLGARPEQSAPYVLLNGKRPPYQLRLPMPATTQDSSTI
jgi:predicted DNA-binding helix-hairpin-helix protein